MRQLCLLLFILLLPFTFEAQNTDSSSNQNEKERDSIRKAEFISSIGNGFVPTKFFNFDLRQFIKFNQFEGFRLGLGGVTSNEFSQKLKLKAYAAYGFNDQEYKYGVGAGFRLSSETNTWISVGYISDLEESGSTTFLTDGRFFQFIEPRRFNIDLFHYHRTTTIGVTHQLAKSILGELHLTTSNINPTYDYTFIPDENRSFTDFELSTLKASLQWSPFSKYRLVESIIIEEKEGYPKFTFQYTRSFEDVLGSDLSFSKYDLRITQKFTHSEESNTLFVLTSGLADGDVPLTHQYHAYPNQITKETILQRFTIAGINSFETMYFNEFFSNKIMTFRVKHEFNRFNISRRFRPQLALLTKYAIGNMDNPEQHEGISFNTLEHGFIESGFEINKLLLGFGLSFAYRYGPYHLPEFEDNFSFKFTFNMNLSRK